MNDQRKLEKILEILVGNRILMQQALRIDEKASMPAMKFITIATRLERMVKYR